MKTRLYAVIILGIALFAGNKVWSHTILGDANLITRGELNPARQDHSSNTMVGPLPSAGVLQGDGLRSTHTASGIAGGLVQNNIGVITSSMVAGNLKFQSPFNIVVGTALLSGVDCIVQNTNQFDLVLASAGARGLSWSATAQARILFRDGIYPNMHQSTIPAGIWVIGSASTVWVDGGNDRQRFVNIYGKADFLKFDYQLKGFQVPKVIVSSGSRIGENGACEFYGLSNQPGTAGPSDGMSGGSFLYFTTGTNNVKVNAVVNGARAVAGLVRYGDIAPVIVRPSSSIYCNFDWTGSTAALGDGTNIGVMGSTDVWFSGRYRQFGNNGFVFQDGCSHCGVRNADIWVDQPAAWNEGVIAFGSNTGPDADIGHISTGCAVSNVNIVVQNNLTAPIIAAPSNETNRRVSGLKISNVSITCEGTNSITAIELVGAVPNIGAIKTVIDNVDIYGCSTGLTDTGLGTNKAGLRLNGVTQ